MRFQYLKNKQLSLKPPYRDTAVQWATEEYQGLQDSRSLSGKSDFSIYTLSLSICFKIYRDPPVYAYHRVNRALAVHRVHLDCLDQVVTQELKGPKVSWGYLDRQ